MEKYIKTKDILNIISKYCKENNISLSKYAQLAGVSKSWLSRLYNENKNVSLQVAEMLLSVAGYCLKITQGQVRISSSRLRRII